MNEMLKKKLQEKLNNKQGFTLLEILVVLTIMGFLIAMVAPRLAGISGGAVDTVCDSNQSRMITMMSAYFERTNRFPSNMVNIVAEDGTDYTLPTVSDDDPVNGAETLASEMQDRNKLAIHILNGTEAQELKNMGITHVINLNSYDNSAIVAADQTQANRRVEVVAGVGVAMVGMGADGIGVDLAIDTSGNYERGWNQADWFGRIVLGFGPENGLITSGLVANAAHCPGGIQNSDNVTYNEYNLVLPRLPATVERFGIDGAADSHDITGLTAATGMAGGELNIRAVAYDSLGDAAYDITGNPDNLKVRTFNIAEAQQRYQYATMCPEGHKFPAESTEFWAVDLAGAVGSINAVP